MEIENNKDVELQICCDVEKDVDNTQLNVTSDGEKSLKDTQKKRHCHKAQGENKEVVSPKTTEENANSAKREEQKELDNAIENMKKELSEKQSEIVALRKSIEEFQSEEHEVSEAQIKKLMKSETFIQENIFSNKFIRDYIILKYLNDIRQGGAPTLISAGGEASTYKIEMPKTIKEAGEIAKKALKFI